jgi:ribonuclease inhibitor
MAEIRIVGAEVRPELDVHRSLERQLEFGDYYGRNVAALRDRLLTDVPRPVRIVWLDSRTSRSRLGEEVFDKIVRVLPRRQPRISRSVGTNDSTSSFNNGRLEPSRPGHN